MAQRPADAGRRPGGRGGTRLALAACLLAVVAAGLRVTVPAPSLTGPFRHDGVAIGAVLEGVLACLLVALMVRSSRAPRDALLAAQLRKMLFYVVVTGLVAIPSTYLLTRHLPPLRPLRTTPGKTARQHLPPLAHPGGTSPVVPIVGILLAVLVLAGLAYVIMALLRGRAWLGFRRGPAGAAVEPGADDEEPGLREAVESGRSALRHFDDAKAAIIACYVAMEQSLAQAGTAREVADTPDELLARAADRGVVRTAAAARLTALFYEARFSSHPMPLAQRDEAQQALGELAASLRGLEPASRPNGARG